MLTLFIWNKHVGNCVGERGKQIELVRFHKTTHNVTSGKRPNDLHNNTGYDLEWRDHLLAYPARVLLQ